MIVRVNAGSVALDNPDDCSAFKVATPSESRHMLSTLLDSSQAGSLDGADALISVDWIRAQCAGKTAGNWNDRFVNMLAFAAARGWVTEDGRYVRGHIETS